MYYARKNGKRPSLIIGLIFLAFTLAACTNPCPTGNDQPTQEPEPSPTGTATAEPGIDQGDSANSPGDDVVVQPAATECPGGCTATPEPTPTSIPTPELDLYGVIITGTENVVHIEFVRNAVKAVGDALKKHSSDSTSPGAFKMMYGDGFTFEFKAEGVGGGDWARTEISHTITISSIDAFDGTGDAQSVRFLIHELGHAFDLAVCDRGHGGAAGSGDCGKNYGSSTAANYPLENKLYVPSNKPGSLCTEQTINGTACLGRPDHSFVDKNNKTTYYGFYGGFMDWQFANNEKKTNAEVFADMFVGWVKNTWEDSDAGKNRKAFMDIHSDAGKNRKAFMDIHMDDYIP